MACRRRWFPSVDRGEAFAWGTIVGAVFATAIGLWALSQVRPAATEFSDHPVSVRHATERMQVAETRATQESLRAETYRLELHEQGDIYLPTVEVLP